MQEIKRLSTAELFDLLAKHTSHYTSLLVGAGITDESETCKQVIQFIQQEIARRKTENNSFEIIHKGSDDISKNENSQS